jgi:hypothetical protein
VTEIRLTSPPFVGAERGEDNSVALADAASAASDYGAAVEQGGSMRGKAFGAAALASALALCLAVAAFGAVPKKGGVYKGTIKSSPFQLGIVMTVAKTGKAMTFTYLCGTGRPPTTLFNVPIDATGHFAWTKKNGSVVVWKMAGHFTSATQAFISLNSLACGGSKGSTTVSLK